MRMQFNLVAPAAVVLMYGTAAVSAFYWFAKIATATMDKALGTGARQCGNFATIASSGHIAQWLQFLFTAASKHVDDFWHGTRECMPIQLLGPTADRLDPFWVLCTSCLLCQKGSVLIGR